MRIKVKIAENNRPFEIHYVDAEAESNVDTFLNGLVMDKLIHAGGMHDYMCDGYEYRELRTQKLSKLFSRDRKIKLISPAAILTLTLKQHTEDQVHHWLLDYSDISNMLYYYYDRNKNAHVATDMVFFIQHDYDYVLIRYSRRHLDFYYMYNHFKEMPAEPDMTLYFKSREQLTKEELKWMRSISFSHKLPKKTVPRGGEIISQQNIERAAVMMHRHITMIGWFMR